MKWVWHRCQVVPWSYVSIAFFKPWWSSEVTKSTPFNPLSFNQMKKSLQLASDSPSPTWSPRTSRYPSWFTPIARSTRRDRTRWSSRILMTKASTIKKGYSLSDKGRLFQAVMRGSSALHNSETVDLENSSPQSSRVMCSTFRVETPLTTISIMARIKACSLRWNRAKRSVENAPFRMRGIRKMRLPTRVVRVWG